MIWVDPARPKPIWLGEYCTRLLADPEWIVEPKWDGYRCLVWSDATGRATCWTRQRKPLDPKGIGLPLFPPRSLLDGEWLRDTRELILWDAPVVGGEEWEAPLPDRWEWICQHVPELGPIRRTVRLQPATAWDRAMGLGAEGMVLKSQAPYPRGDTYHWLKVKG